MSDGTWDDYFVAGGPSLNGFDTSRVTSNDGHTPVFNRGVVGVGRTNGVWGHVEETTQFPPSLVGGVFGSGIIQPGVIGFSRDSDGVQALSFTGTCLRAASSFGPGVHSISGALTGVTGISGTQGPTVQNTSNIAGVLGTSDAVNGVIGTSNRSIGVVGFSNNVGVFSQSTAGGSSSDRKRSRPIRAFSATPHDGQRRCRTLAEDPGRTQSRAAYPRRCSSNASGLHGRNSARILGIRASFQRDNLRRHF